MVYFLYGIIFVITIIALILIVYSVWYLANILFWYWVPNVTTNKLLHKVLIDDLSLKEWDTFIDLWCWEWVVVNLVSKAFPWATCLWYESWPRAYKIAVKNKEEDWWTYELHRKDFFKEDIHHATVIYCYLMPHLMKKVWWKISSECKKWTRVYSNAFAVPDLEPRRTLVVPTDTGKEKTIYIYTVK